MIENERAKVLTHTLDRAMTKVISNDRVRDEMAFHIADILRDFREIEPIIDKAFEQGELSHNDVDSILSLMLIHWPYHLKGLARLNRRLKREKPVRAKPIRRQKK